MLRRLLRHLFLLLAFAGLLPGAQLVLEQVVELAHHGHPAHSVPGEPDPLNQEHGCTPIGHECSCHQGQAADLARYCAAAPLGADWLTWILDAGSRHASSQRLGPTRNETALYRANPPPTPPPNA